MVDLLMSAADGDVAGLIEDSDLSARWMHSLFIPSLGVTV